MEANSDMEQLLEWQSILPEQSPQMCKVDKPGVRKYRSYSGNIGIGMSGEQTSNYLCKTRAFTKERKDWPGRKRPYNYSKDQEIKRLMREIKILERSGLTWEAEEKKRLIRVRNREIEDEQFDKEYKRIFASQVEKEYCPFCKETFESGHIINCTNF